MTMYIECSYDLSIDTSYTRVTHTILTSLNIEYEEPFSRIKFTPIEYLLYPQLKEEEMDSDSSVELKPDFTFIKGLYLSNENTTQYLITTNEEVIEYSMHTAPLFDYLREVLVA